MGATARDFSPPPSQQSDGPRGRFPSNTEDISPMVTHGHGTLVNLIKSSRPSVAQYNSDYCFISYKRGRDSINDEEIVRMAGKDCDEMRHKYRSSEDRRLENMLNGSPIRSQRLIGHSTLRYEWEKYWKTRDELKKMRKPIRKYYERTNNLIQNYIYIDRLLDSSLPHDLLNEYSNVGSYTSLQNDRKKPSSTTDAENEPRRVSYLEIPPSIAPTKKIKRTPRELYFKISNEETPLLNSDDGERKSMIPGPENEESESGDRIVQIAIYVNLFANVILLITKITTILLTNSLSVLASLVDAALDLLSTGIVWTTSKLIEKRDHYSYPIGRRRLEPLGVLIFSVIMVTSFFQVGIQCIARLNSDDHTIIQLTMPAIIPMSATIIIKLLCWIWCRMVKNSGVQALAQDAMTDVIFNIFSIIFPLVGFYAKLWWFDALGGLLLSLYIVINWSTTSAGHIRNLTGAAATADERNVLLYLTMRFARTIKQIQGLQAYHCGDKLNVEVDVVLDEQMTLRDSHDLGESLQYVLESVPIVDRAFVHQDYAGWNLPTHMEQQSG
ncbi:Metal tolerance protein 3 [Erysiphe neolycopersici]|uniref:Metal tolerance protein 3 n=1 Tax=Erysiphe neolycopersici TaxID=212602 RepID=A0A420I6W1_9PEZI|nr:Metal tolerance protein 3 [Erysiphe neolycopersici]